MKYPRSIIYIGKEKNSYYVHTLEGYKYNTDDVTDDGLVYTNNGWIQVFKSESDLSIIKNFRNYEEIYELKNMCLLLTKQRNIAAL